MSKQLFKRLIPNQDTIRNNKYLQVFGRLIHAPHLWHINRHSTAGAFAIGFFVAFVPLPSQMLIAAAAAIFFRVNLPLSITLVWITNPVTMPAIIYFCYMLGSTLLGYPVELFTFSLPEGGYWVELLTSSIFEVRFWTELFNFFLPKGGFWTGMSHSLPPFLLGCLVSSIIFSSIAYFSVHLAWRWHVVHRWNLRRTRRLAKSATATNA